MDSKRNRFDQLFEMAGRRPKPDGYDLSFADVVYSQIGNRFQLNADGDLEAVDHLGIRRYSPKDARNVMSGLEYLEELKLREVFAFCFSDNTNSANDTNNDRVMSREDFEKLSGAEQLTLARDGKAPERLPIEEIDIKLSNAEQLTRARAAKAARDKEENKE